MIPIQITNGVFTIVRNEAYANVQHSVEYNNHSIELINKLYLPSEDEGGTCEIHYIFKILSKNSSEIKFIDKYDDDTIIHEKYIVNPSNSNVRYVGNRNNCCIN
jgi:hypothetical protein